MVKLFIKDLLAFNGIAIVISLILFLLGWSVMNAIFISLLGLCALLLIFGGVLGFFLSSVSFDSLLKYIGIGREKRELAGELQDEARDRKNKEKERREQVNTGKRMIIVGLILFCESLLVSLILFM